MVRHYHLYESLAPFHVFMHSQPADRLKPLPAYSNHPRASIYIMPWHESSSPSLAYFSLHFILMLLKKYYITTLKKFSCLMQDFFFNICEMYRCFLINNNLWIFRWLKLRQEELRDSIICVIFKNVDFIILSYKIFILTYILLKFLIDGHIHVFVFRFVRKHGW